MSRLLTALLGLVILLIGALAGWITRGSDFGEQLANEDAGSSNGFVQVSAPEQAQLVAVMGSLEVPATPQSGLSGERLVNISAALSALQTRADEVAAAFTARDAAVEAAKLEAQSEFKEKEAALTALLAVERKDLLDLVSGLEGDVEAREAEIAERGQAMADIQQKYDETLNEITALQLEADALSGDNERLSNALSVAEERLIAIGDADSVTIILEQQKLRASLAAMQAEHAAMQQSLSDLTDQIDAAKLELDDLSGEQQTSQRLLEALRSEGERLLKRQEAAQAALEPAENAVFEAQTEAENLRIEATALRSEIAAKIEERDTVLNAIASFGAAVAESGQVQINGEPISAEAAIQTLRNTLIRETEAREQLVETQSQLEELATERERLDETIDTVAEGRAARLTADANARVAEAEAEVAAMKAQLLSQSSNRERELTQQLAQLEANVDAQIAQQVAERVAEALAASLNSAETTLNAQAETRFQAQFEAEKARLISEIQSEANDRLEAERAALISRFNSTVESRAEELASELAQRLAADEAIANAASTGTAGAASQAETAAGSDAAEAGGATGFEPDNQVAAMAAIRERLYSRLVDATSTEFGYTPRVVGERLLLASNDLFPVGSPNLSREGRDELQIFGQQLERILADLDDEQFMVRVDGHADIKPYLFSPYGNWELSSERAVSVVEYLIENTNIPASRLMVAAFAEHQPLVEGDDETAQRQNRRIEFKLVRR